VAKRNPKPRRPARSARRPAATPACRSPSRSAFRPTGRLTKLSPSSSSSTRCATSSPPPTARSYTTQLVDAPARSQTTPTSSPTTIYPSDRRRQNGAIGPVLRLACPTPSTNCGEYLRILTGANNRSGPTRQRHILPAVSSVGGFRTPAPSKPRRRIKGWRPKPFTIGDIDVGFLSGPAFFETFAVFLGSDVALGCVTELRLL